MGQVRSGIGFDIHRLIPTLKKSTIAIGGIEIPCFYNVEAHSDGDVLLHAITDACLGALALGDIGQWFPDSDKENEGARSERFVQFAMSKIHLLGWKVVNCDTNVFLEEPRLSNISDEIRRRIAALLQIEMACVSVKAKTLEKIGPIGESKAIAAQAIVVLENHYPQHS